MTDRPPCLHDGKPSLEQRIGLVGQQIPHALPGRPVRIVVVHAPRRTLEPFRPADYPRRRDAPCDRRCGCERRRCIVWRSRSMAGIVDSPYAFGVQKVDRRQGIALKFESVHVERDRLGPFAGVQDRNVVPGGAAAEVPPLGIRRRPSRSSTCRLRWWRSPRMWVRRHDQVCGLVQPSYIHYLST